MSTPTPEQLNQEIAAQSTLLTDLRKQQAEASIVEEAKKKLGDLKRALALLSGAGSSKEGAKKKERILLKTPKVRSVLVLEWTLLKLTRTLVCLHLR